MKRKIELPTALEMLNKALKEEDLTKAEKLVCLLADSDTDSAVINALQEAYNQGYEDAMPKWLPIESAPNYTEVLIAGHDDYDGVVLASRNSDGEFTTDEGFSLSNPTHWMPLPPPPTL